MLTSEKVTSRKGLYFGVSSDLVSSNVAIFIFLMLNIGFMMLMQFVVSFLRKNNVVRQLVLKFRWSMVCFQITNIFGPLLLPWTFLLMNAGVNNFGTKMNMIAYLIIFFMGIIFPVVYFFDLLAEREN